MVPRICQLKICQLLILADSLFPKFSDRRTLCNSFAQSSVRAAHTSLDKPEDTNTNLLSSSYAYHANSNTLPTIVLYIYSSNAYAKHNIFQQVRISQVCQACGVRSVQMGFFNSFYLFYLDISTISQSQCAFPFRTSRSILLLGLGTCAVAPTISR